MDIPDEIMIEITLWLPLRFLILLRTVDSYFYKLLSTESFEDYWCQIQRYRHGYLKTPCDQLYFGNISYHHALLEGMWKFNRKCGVHNVVTEDGTKIGMETYNNGILHGDRRAYYLDSNIQLEENYDKGKISGLRRIWHPDKQLLLEENFISGRRHGNCKRWNRDGNLIEIENYICGHRIRRYEYYSDGNLRVKESYVGGHLQGSRYEYHTNGILSSEEPYEDGQLSGTRYSWTNDGILIMKQIYYDGLIQETIMFNTYS